MHEALSVQNILYTLRITAWKRIKNIKTKVEGCAS